MVTSFPDRLYVDRQRSKVVLSLFLAFPARVGAVQRIKLDEVRVSQNRKTFGVSEQFDAADALPDEWREEERGSWLILVSGKFLFRLVARSKTTPVHSGPGDTRCRFDREPSHFALIETPRRRVQIAGGIRIEIRRLFGASGARELRSLARHPGRRGPCRDLLAHKWRWRWLQRIQNRQRFWG